MQELKVRLVGKQSLLMHSDKLADPRGDATKEHKALNKRKKTDEDHDAIAQSEFVHGMYFDDALGPYMPGLNIEAAMLAGAKLSKLGTQLKRAAQVIDDKCALEYKGPRDRKGLWEAKFYDSRTVKVGTARIVRYRPKFDEWACECTIVFDPRAIDRAQIVKCLQDAGDYCGLGDYRPKFGRFNVEVLA